MPIFKIHKEKNFTVVDTNILKNQNLSYGAKGLLITCLSLPEDWSFSVKGLSALSTNKRVSVENLLTELKQNGYLKVEQTRTNNRIDYVYSFYEKPLSDVDFPSAENQQLEINSRKSTVGNQHLYSIKDKELNNQEFKDKECRDDITTPLPPKGKKKSLKDQNLDTLTELMGGYNFSQEITAKLVEWYTYKAEKKKPITPTGMKTQLSQVSKQIGLIGESNVIDVIEKSMANDYQGMIWDLATKNTSNKRGMSLTERIMRV